MNGLVSLRRASLADLEFFFQLRNDTIVRNVSFDSEKIIIENHSRWYKNKLDDPNAYLFVILAHGEQVGQIRVDHENNYGVISLAIVEEHRGNGYGFMAIRDVCTLIFSENPNLEFMLAYIGLENTASLKTFMRIGFSQEDIVNIRGHQAHKTVLRKNEYLLDQLSKSEFMPPFPKVLRIEPASACNFQCVHCPTGLNMNPDVGIMGMDIFDRIFEKIQRYRFRVIVMFHGGEPFLNKNLFEMAKKLRPLADRIELNSNASVLSNTVIGQILATDCIDRISFSIDGNSPEENNQIRVGANFQKIVVNIKKLISTRNKLGLTRPRIFIANTQIPETSDQVSHIEVPQFLLNEFKEMESEVSFKSTYSLIWAGMAIQPGSSQPNNNFCDHVVNTFTIRANGDVVPCCYDLTTEMLMGNVLEQSPEEIWQGKKYIGLRKSIAAFKPPKLCRGCEVLYPKAVMTRKDIKIT